MLLPFWFYSCRFWLLIILAISFPTGFFFADFPYVDNDCRFQIANLFAVDIDLDTKRFVKAKLDDELLTAKEAVILLWFNTSKVTSFDYGAVSFVFQKLTSHIIPIHQKLPRSTSSFMLWQTGVRMWMTPWTVSILSFVRTVLSLLCITSLDTLHSAGSLAFGQSKAFFLMDGQILTCLWWSVSTTESRITSTSMLRLNPS